MPRTAPRRLLLAAVLCMLTGACGEPSTTAQPPHVVLICLDTVRADRLGAFGYTERATTPHLDALASRSVVFADTAATAGWTKPSVPTIFTGTYPAQHGVYEGSARGEFGKLTHVLGDGARTLAESFRDEGYRTAAFVRNAQLKPGGGFEQGFDLYRDQAGDAREIRWRALDWLDEHATEGPAFLYLHILDAHMPYDIPDEYVERWTTVEDAAPFREKGWRDLRDALNDGQRTLTEDEQRALAALYDGAIRFIDDEVGRLVAGLERRGLADDTVICVVADHGEEFMEHGRLGHGHGLWENLLRVAWILSAPGLPARRVETPVSLVDLYPTLLAACGLPADGASPGVDRTLPAGETPPVFAEHKAPDAYVQSFRSGSSKLVRRYEPTSQPASLTLARTLSGSSRWEAEVAVDASGQLRALQLKPLDGDGDEPLELKGRATDVDASGFRVAGAAIVLASDVKPAGPVDLSPEGRIVVREGDALKVSGRFLEGTFVAEKIKSYAETDPLDTEVRGPVSQVEGDSTDEGRLRIGDLWIRFEAATNWKGLEDLDHGPRLTRDDVLVLLEAGPQGAAAAGFRVEEQLFDLAADPGEQHPVHTRIITAVGAEAHEIMDRLGAGLDQLGRQLRTRRTWTAADSATLSDETLGDLRALGYIR